MRKNMTVEQIITKALKNGALDCFAFRTAYIKAGGSMWASEVITRREQMIADGKIAVEWDERGNPIYGLAA